MATSAKRTRTKSTRDEEEESELKTLVAALLSLGRMSSRDMTQGENEQNMESETKSETEIMPSSFSENITQTEKNQPTEKRKTVEEDDSENTLKILLRWNTNMPKIPPEKIVFVVGQRCSKPIRKQLTKSDVKKNQNRLMLGKKQVENKFWPLLEKSEIPGKEGIKVSVYGPDGEVHEMTFKMWNEKTPVLMSGWNEFVRNYKLKMHCHFLTIWMFRNIDRDSIKICFAIDFTEHSITKQLSRRISNAALKDSN